MCLSLAGRTKVVIPRRRMTTHGSQKCNNYTGGQREVDPLPSLAATTLVLASTFQQSSQERGRHP
jgi:hypothetical protein